VVVDAAPADFRREPVTDVLMLAIVAAFFLLAGALVVGCDRILGPDAGLGDGEALVDEARG
jgi:hypothetical protein